MKRIFTTIAFALLVFHCGVLAQTIEVIGMVQDGFLKQIVPGLNVSLHKTDSTVINKSLTLTHVQSHYKGGDLTYYNVDIPASYKECLIHAEAEGYSDVWKKVQLPEKGDMEVPMIDMRRARELKEVSVVATKVKMFYRGDTLIYDATAFKLPDGSMLDALIRQLPGVELKDNGEIIVNGRRVDELLLGSRSFMRGNRKVLMENLPYYTVKDLKVYEKASDESIALGHDVGGKTYVMDVNLKQEYQIGYIANVEAAAGTPPRGSGEGGRWLGRGFLLGFTDRWRYTLLGNANNVNESQHIGQSGNWSPQRMPSNMVTTRNASGEADYVSKNEKVKNTLTANYQHTTSRTEMNARHETFLSGMTPLSLTERTVKDGSRQVEVNNFFRLLKPFYLTIQGNIQHEKTNGNSWSDFRQWGDTLTATMLNTSMDESTRTSGFIRTDGTFCVNKKTGADIGIDNIVFIYDNKTENASQYQVGLPSALDVSHNAGNTRLHVNEFNPSAFYRQSLDAENSWAIYVGTRFNYRDEQSHDYLYHPDTLALPSQLASLAAFIDPKNSYDARYTKRHETLNIHLRNNTHSPLAGFLVVSERFGFDLNIDALQHNLNYQRGVIDTLAHYHTVHVNPSASFRQKFGKNSRNEVRASANFTTQEMDLMQTIAFRDDSQPLIVRLGNPDLKARQTTGMSFDYANHNGPHRQEVSVGTRFEYSVRDIAESLSYNTATGVYTYQPINVHGGYTWSNGLNYSRNLDQKNRWSVQSNANASLHHSLDHTMFTGEAESHLNAVNTLTVGEKAYIQYNKDALNLRATGSISWRHSVGKMVDFETLDAFDYQYGLNGYYTIPKLKTTLSVDATMYSRRGYGSSDLNTDDFVLNASLSQPFLKGKLIARIEAFDLLHQLSNTQYAVNAQGRTITWYRSLPHYAMLHLVYHWNKNPKKK